jgi:uncharacterized protein (DUF1778 family)
MSDDTASMLKHYMMVAEQERLAEEERINLDVMVAMRTLFHAAAALAIGDDKEFIIAMAAREELISDITITRMRMNHCERMIAIKGLWGVSDKHSGE